MASLCGPGSLSSEAEALSAQSMHLCLLLLLANRYALHEEDPRAHGSIRKKRPRQQNKTLNCALGESRFISAILGDEAKKKGVKGRRYRNGTHVFPSSPGGDCLFTFLCLQWSFVKIQVFVTLKRSRAIDYGPLSHRFLPRKA